MKILIVSCEGLGRGGVQQTIMTIRRKLVNVDMDILLFTNEIRYHEKEFTNFGGRIFRIPHLGKSGSILRRLDYYIRFPRIFFKTLHILKKYGSYDIIHSHNDLESGIINFAGKINGVNIRISHAHIIRKEFKNKIFILFWYRKFLKRLIIKNSTHLLAASREAFISQFGKSFYTDDKVFSPSIPVVSFLDYNKKSNNDNHIISLVSIGRFDENKNQIFMIRILKELHNRNFKCNLLLMGFGDEYKKQIEKEIELYNLQKYVKFFRSDYDKRKFLSKGNLFILTSKSEGFGIVLLEAQAMSLKTLSSDVVSENINVGLCEFASLNKDSSLWADKLISMINSKNKYELNIKKLFEFDDQKYIDRIWRLYNEKI
jgi:glycosyltransferase involved in cell wall biosynthesis